MNLNEIYAPYVEMGLVKKVEHPFLSLTLYDYTMACQMDDQWDTNTLAARGLVVDNHTGKRVVRNMDKFFNHSEKYGVPIAQRALSEPHIVTEKMDGSLVMATLIRDMRVPLVHTRGSFKSQQAIDAFEWLRREHGFEWMQEGWTYCFEWIAPHNRIVVNYHGREELVMLCAQNVEGELTPRFKVSEWGGEHATTFGVTLTEEYGLETLRSTIPPTEEGYVVHLMDGSRFKIKGEEYIRRHRLISGLNEKRVWESLMIGDDPHKELAGILEEEDLKWLEDVQTDLTKRVLGKMRGAYDVHTQLAGADISDIGRIMKNNGVEQDIITMVYFIRRGQRDRAEAAAWKSVKPEGRGKVFSGGLLN